MQPTYRPLNKDEQGMMELYRDMAAKICKKYIAGFDGKYNAALLSKVFGLWLEDNDPFVKTQYDMDFHAESGKKPAAYMIKMTLGTVFGDILNSNYKSEWMYVTDAYGSEISIYHKGANYGTFPYSSVEKRIASKELNFFQPIEEMMKAQVAGK